MTDPRDDAWREVALGGQYAYSDDYSSIAFDLGWIAALRWMSEKYGRYYEESKPDTLKTIWLTISRISSEEADSFERGV